MPSHTIFCTPQINAYNEAQSLAQSNESLEKLALLNYQTAI